MNKSKVFLLLFSAILVFGVCSYSVVSAQELSGYVYSQDAGWISLNCSNTSSCVNVDYAVSQDNDGNLSGYGYSENDGWINFNPNFGGANINADNSLSGWIYSQAGTWVDISGAKVVSVPDLQNEVTYIKNTVSGGNLSDDDTASLLNSLCNKFFSANMCAAIAK